jgi:hypothetical protein
MENTNYGLGWGNDTLTYTTFFRHLDFDFATDTLIANATNADVTLPNSLVYNTKPASAGSMAWPYFNPTNRTTANMSITNVPAGYRLITGNETPSDSGTTYTQTSNRKGTMNFKGTQTIK